MCGIAGIFNLDGSVISKNDTGPMLESIHHRGPDGQGDYQNQNLWLGHTRLAIMDASSAAAQPMMSEDQRYVLSYNGEIYNFKELRQQLESKGYHFRSKGDTEVVLYALMEWGSDAIPRFNGMFAFAFWDKKERVLLLARDRYGIKPLYYFLKNNKLIFASEIKAILKHSQVSADVNLEALNEYFTFQNLFQHHTFFKNINIVPPANIFKVKCDPVEIQKNVYWDFNFTDKDDDITEQEAQLETLRLIQQATERQLVADVPVGAYLSGGMDSGSIVALAVKHMPHMV